METLTEITTPAKPQPILNTDSTATTPASKMHLEPEPRSSITLADDCTEEDFNPFSTAKPCSPFYLYNHDSPRTSTDQRQQLRKPPSIHVSVHDLDLEKGTSNLSATQSRTPSQEKQCNGNKGVLRMWNGRVGKTRCMTKPKQSRWQLWMASLPKWQRLGVKLAIALLLIGAIVGIAVGISVRVHGGVYSGANNSSSIGS